MLSNIYIFNCYQSASNLMLFWSFSKDTQRRIAEIYISSRNYRRRWNRKCFPTHRGHTWGSGECNLFWRSYGCKVGWWRYSNTLISFDNYVMKRAITQILKTENTVCKLRISNLTHFYGNSSLCFVCSWWKWIGIGVYLLNVVTVSFWNLISAIISEKLLMSLCF